MPTIVDRTEININEDRPLETKKQVQEYAKAIKQYTETNGKAFLDKYSYLPNLLIEMDKLEQEGKGWYEIIDGMGSYLFRVLIISKLCNDPDFDRKLSICDNNFNTNPILIRDGWHPYYEQLKLKLSALSPKYNL